MTIIHNSYAKGVPVLGDKGYHRPSVEVGGKLACSNLWEIRHELVKALEAGFRKCDLMVFRMAGGKVKLFLLDGFCMKHVQSHPDIVGELRDRQGYLGERDMLYVSVTDQKTGAYEVGVLDQERRVVHSIPSRRARREAARRTH